MERGRGAARRSRVGWGGRGNAPRGEPGGGGGGGEAVTGGSSAMSPRGAAGTGGPRVGRGLRGSAARPTDPGAGVGLRYSAPPAGRHSGGAVDLTGTRYIPRGITHSQPISHVSDTVKLQTLYCEKLTF